MTNRKVLHVSATDKPVKALNDYLNSQDESYWDRYVEIQWLPPDFDAPYGLWVIVEGMD